MSKKYKEKQPTGREHVDATREFTNIVYYICDRLPKRWENTYIAPILRCADEAESLVCRANKIYINPNTQDAQTLKHAYSERINMLTEAINVFADFDVKFERLMQNIDLCGSERKRIKAIMYKILKEEQEKDPSVKNINIQINTKEDSMQYTSMNGNYSEKLKLTPKSRDRILKAESEALYYIKGRISADKKAVKGL